MSIHTAGSDPMTLDDFSETTATFGDRLVAAREAAGLGQTELARQLGVKVATLRNWEEDRSEPRANKLGMLAGLVNASIVWLLSGQGSAPRGADGTEGAVQSADVIEDLRRIRAEHTLLGERMALLEDRLKALLA